MQGLGCCAQSDNFIAHHFYASTFVHNTSVCLAVDADNIVHVTNKEECWGTVMGWGEGSND